jgi:hypothetical protein
MLFIFRARTLNFISPPTDIANFRAPTHFHGYNFASIFEGERTTRTWFIYHITRFLNHYSALQTVLCVAGFILDV